MSEIETLVAELINRATRIGEGAALTGRAYESDVTLAAAARAAILREFDAQAKRIRELEAERDAECETARMLRETMSGQTVRIITQAKRIRELEAALGIEDASE